jgi:hypothetical protein
MSANDLLKMEIIMGTTPRTSSDSSFIDNLKEFGYAKTNVDKSNFEDIDRIFTEKTVDKGLSTTCIPIYRDILIFKRHNQVIGTAKICFECMDSQIVGTNANTGNFGQDGDYSQLQKVLRN